MNTLIVMTSAGVLCCVSIVLTSLFAFSFSASRGEDLGIVALVLTLAIGVSVDLSKYLFWIYRKAHYSFYFISLILLLFSWSASVSFFVTSERSNVERARLASASYQSHLAQIESLKQRIENKQHIIKARLASAYHDQWDKAEKLSLEITQLNSELSALLLKTQSIGMDDAESQIGSSTFFKSLANLMSTSTLIISSSFYGLLALMIETCSISLISLSGYLPKEKSNGKSRNAETEDFESTGVNAQTDIDKGEGPQRAVDNDKVTFDQVRVDILMEKVPPIARQIMNRYKLRHSEVKEMLNEMYRNRELEKKKNKYTLNPAYKRSGNGILEHKDMDNQDEETSLTQ